MPEDQRATDEFCEETLLDGHGDVDGVAFPYRRDTIPANYDNIMWIPLFIKEPARAVGRISDRPMQSIDVLPTMADILGVKIPWKVDGRSALGAPRTPDPVTIIRNDIGFVGRKQTFDGPAGFAKVLRAQAARSGGDPALHVYRIGTSGRRISRPAAPLVRGSRPRRGTRSTPAGWNNVGPKADAVPWTTSTGTVPGGAQYDAILAPALSRAGKNDLTAFLVTGLPRTACLVPVEMNPRGPCRSRGSFLSYGTSLGPHSRSACACNRISRCQFRQPDRGGDCRGRRSFRSVLQDRAAPCDTRLQAQASRPGDGCRYASRGGITPGRVHRARRDAPRPGRAGT